MNIQLFSSISFFLIISLLTACGGGGGGGGEDTTPPVVTAPADIIVEAVDALGTTATNTTITTFLAASSAVDAVDDIDLTFSHNAPTTFPLGATVVTFSYTDTSDNTGTANATVTVSDTIAPVVTAPGNIVVEAPGTAAITTFLAGSTSADAVDPAPIVTNNAPSPFPLGATVVTFTHTDASGNAGTATATVTVVDTIAPVVTAPANTTVEAHSSSAALTAFLAGSTVVEVGDPSPAFSHNAPAAIPLGPTVVTFTYTDAAGNVGTDTATVTGIDTTPPVITLIGANTITIDLHSTFVDPGSTVSDAVSTSLAATVTGAVDVDTVGVYILSYDVTDGVGNAATTVTRTVNVEVAAPTNVSFTISGKHLNFTWDASTALDFTRISINPDGASGFTVDPSATNIPANATGFSLEIPVHLTDWVNAQYIVEACDTALNGCKSSPNQTVTQTDSIPAIFYVKASNTDANDNFGNHVVISGDGNTMGVVAAEEDSNATGVDGNQADNSSVGSGAVYVFVKSGTTWVQQAYIKASNADASDRLGGSITFRQGGITLSDDGNTLAVATQLEASIATGINGNQADNSAPKAGAVYVFTRSGTAWTQQAYVKASNTDAFDEFGVSVTLSGDGNTLAVGANHERSNATGINGDQTNNSLNVAGAVYVFTRSGTTWTQQAYVKAPVASGNRFGDTVALNVDGNTLAVGAGVNNENGNSSGAAYVFTRSGTIWTQQQKITPSNAESLYQFGRYDISLSGDGNTLAVGTEEEDSNATGIGGDQTDNSAVSAGAVYVFSRSGTTWTQQAYVKASNTDAGDRFGTTTSLNGNGNILAVGAPRERSLAIGIGGDQTDNSLPGVGEGAVYVFLRTGTTWTQQSYVKASNVTTSKLFGRSVSLDSEGDDLAVGAATESGGTTGIGGDQNDTSASGAGAVYLY